MALEKHIRAQGWTLADAARRLGVTLPRMYDLLAGKIDLFKLEALASMAVAAGLHVKMSVSNSTAHEEE